MKPFSIVIPTWKNIEYLDLTYRGLLRNSAVEHEIIVFFNEYDKSCEDWSRNKNILFDRSDRNTGVCEAVNRGAGMATFDHICYMNDDMYPLPGWDTALAAYIGYADKLWLSGTAIESGNSTPCYIGNQDYGNSPTSFDEERLLREYRTLIRSYNTVSTWTPVLLSKSDWDEIDGFDENYFPGFGSDPDLAMKMYRYGCRHFIGVGSSLVYHFAKQTTVRFEDNSTMDPGKYFRQKWGISWKKFFRTVIHRDRKLTP
ncbi:MAG: glycosyltransferase [Candidatus Fermentibacteraceae bacterium]|nr:glycosyltransferase [Candidatus Fermentibacteraceae bacterium]